LGDEGLMQKGCRFYEGLVRVPLIFSWPATFPAGRQCRGLVELLDLSATLLSAAGVSLPAHHQGRDLLPILRGEQNGEEIRDSVRCEYFDSLDPHFTGGAGSFATMYRTERYNHSLYHDKNLGELYDLENDPWEFENLWDEPAAAAIKHELILEGFNAHAVLTTDVGSRRIAPM